VTENARLVNKIQASSPATDRRRPSICLKAFISLSFAAGPHEKSVTFNYLPHF
jgi:hypothetical protein